MSGGVKRDRFGAWLGFGAGAHALFAAGAMLLTPSDLLRLVQGLRLDQHAMFATCLDIGVEAPPRPAPTPPPEPAVVEAPAITPSPPAPLLMKPPEPTPKAEAPIREAIENHSHRFFEAAA